MNKINIITPTDKLYNDAYSILVLYPSTTIQKKLQSWLLSLTELSVNVYVYQEQLFTHDSFIWLLDVFNLVDTVIIDIDQFPEHSNISQILSYMIAKPKTYWLTSNQHLVYSYISNNKIYDLSFLSTVGVFNDKKQ